MNDFFQTSMFAGVALSIISYLIGVALKKKFNLGIFNPLLISIVISIIVLFLSLRLVESAEVCFGKKVGRLWLLLHLAILHEAERFLATTIHLDDFHRTLCRDGLQVGSHVLVG